MTATGKPQVFTEKCDTCVFRPGNRMQLEEGRLAELVEHNLAGGAVLICHKTTYGQHPELGETMCRGFFDAYGDQANVVRVMERLHAISGDQGTWYAEVEPPTEHDPLSRGEST